MPTTAVSVKNTDPIREALKRATDAYSSTGQDYSASLLAGGSIRQALEKAINESDPTIGQLRTEKAQAAQRLGSVFANSMTDLKDVTDPAMREAIRARRSAEYGSEADRIGGLISDMGASRDKQVQGFTDIFGAQNQAKQFDVEQKRQAMERLLQQKNTMDQRTFESRMDDLTRREKEASIAASNRSNRTGAGGLTTLQLLGLQDTNPLGLAQLKGYTREVAPNGGKGYWFYDKNHKPVTVDEVANATGGNRAALLADSSNPADQQMIQQSSGKSLSPAAKQQQVNAASGSQSLSQIENLLNKGISNKDMLTSKTGLSSLFASSSAKQYRDAARNVADMVARLRTGAQINEKEMTLYLQFVPGPSDDPATRAQKIATLKTIFGGGSGALPPDTVIPDTGV